MDNRPKRGEFRQQHGEWASLAVAGIAAVALWQLVGTVWPWLLALGVLMLAAMIGLRRPGALAAGLAAADAWWLASVPLWAWVFVAGVAAAATGVWWAWTWWRKRPDPTARQEAERLPAVRSEPSVAATDHACPDAAVPPRRAAALPVPGLGVAVRRWHAAIAIAAGAGLIAAGILGWRADTATAAAQRQAELDAAHHEAFSRILPRTGADLVHYLVAAIAGRRPEKACFAFVPEAGRDFAAAFGAESCEAAIDRLSRQLPVAPHAGIAYENATGAMVLPGAATTDLGGGRKIVDACAVNVSPPGAGPDRFGIFTMQQVSGEGSQIVAYSRCL
ncbi:hypothetical protein L3Q65_01040 (plasmid) [Amycolatopsis sp. FU40]|uniref:hypothetical protein n=1 Tax=Amycolatopsis sp. FU40 TaxID=2914159 RepID=UPI001F439624|nr:hypothetical protein [Amycolatopsis sp. FU40]UKD50911.1 hypothetical protein L3Q65_01040 [Amycolatopsis sp. FU40]